MIQPMNKVEVKHQYSFKAHELFESFLDIEKAQHFLFRTDNGQLVVAEMQPEAGSGFTLIEKRGDELAAHYGTFVEIEKPERITFVLSTKENSNDSLYVEVQLNEQNGKTWMTISHEIQPEQLDIKKKLEAGWASILDKLELFLSNALATKLAGQALETKDSLGNILSEGDSVKTIKDLNVKGSSMVVKRGTIVKKIHLIKGNDQEIDCKVDGVALALETRWLVKV